MRKRNIACPEAAFTLLELLTVIVIIALLATLLLPAIKSLHARAERFSCTQNLKSLFVATESYIQDNGHWPQIDPLLIPNDRTDHQYSKAWIDALSRYGIQQKGWICPTQQHLQNDPDFTKPENARIDYIAMPFDAIQFTPHAWPRQPWFIERAAAHGSGNLVILTDGSVQPFDQLNLH